MTLRPTGGRLQLVLITAMALSIAAVVAKPAPAESSVTIGGPFALVDQHGALRRSEDFRSRYLLVTFGYTSCPDICPTTLVKLTLVLEALDRRVPARTARLTPIFITVDPERDTPEVLAGYAQHFDPRWVILTGAQTDIDAVSRAYGVFAAKTLPDADGWHFVDHSSFIYLMGPDGRYVSHFEHDVTIEGLVETLIEQIEVDNKARALSPAPGQPRPSG